jgi:CheY-like chemotaxis protein
MDSEQQQGLDAGLDGCLTKPLKRSALLDVLASVAAARAGILTA